MRITNYTKYSTIWPIIKRHWRTSWRFLNFVKIINILWSKINEITGKEIINSRPYFIKIEPTNKCNLRCHGCLHAADKITGSSSLVFGDMDFGIFQKIIGELKRYLVKVSLYSEGEPLIYPRIAEMVKYLTANNIASVISSNFNFLTPELARDLVKNKLTHLIVCLDGFDADSYQKFRNGGDYNKVINNIKLIQAEKDRQKSELPFLEIQAIRLKYFSKEDYSKIKKIAKNLGANNFLIKDDLSQSYNNPQPVEKSCFWLYGNPQIKWNGLVQPCCYYYEDNNNDWGDLVQEDFKNIWNNEKYQAARKYFKTGIKNNQNIKCHNCVFFKKKYVK